MNTEHMTVETKLKIAEALLKRAHEALGNHWFDGSYNNAGVINASEAIDAYFRGDEPLKVSGNE